jgi:Flp pilus assembly pilin Flp
MAAAWRVSGRRARRLTGFGGLREGQQEEMPLLGVSLKKLLTRLWRDERGAPLTEYTILIGLIAVGVITLVVLVAGWIGGVWTNLHSILNPGQ